MISFLNHPLFSPAPTQEEILQCLHLTKWRSSGRIADLIADNRIQENRVSVFENWAKSKKQAIVANVSIRIFPILRSLETEGIVIRKRGDTLSEGEKQFCEESRFFYLQGTPIPFYKCQMERGERLKIWF